MPVIPEGLGIVSFKLPVALEYHGAAHDDFADFALGHWQVGAIHDSHRGKGQGPAGGAGAVVVGPHGGQQGGFGLPVKGVEGAAGDLLVTLDGFRSVQSHDGAQGIDRQTAAVLFVQNGFEDGREFEHQGDLMFGDEFNRPDGVELGNIDIHGPGMKAHQGHVEPGDVEKGQQVEMNIPGCHAEAVHQVQVGTQQIAMTEQCAARPAGHRGGVDDYQAVRGGNFRGR